MQKNNNINEKGKQENERKFKFKWVFFFVKKNLKTIRKKERKFKIEELEQT